FYRGCGLVPDNRHPCSVVFEKAFELMRGIQRDVLDDGGAEFLNSHKCCQALWAVGQDDGNAVARADAKGLEAGGRGTYLLVYFFIGLAAAEEIGGWFIRVAL